MNDEELDTSSDTLIEDSNGHEDTSDTSSDFDFRSMLPDEYKNLYPEFKRPEDFVKGYDQLVRKLGNSISIPKEDAGHEEIEKFYAKLGRPDSPDKYEIDVNKELIDDEFVNNFKNAAYENGFNQKQAKGFMEWFNKQVDSKVKEDQRQAEAQKERAEAELKIRWGNKYEENLQKARDFAKTVIDKNSQEKIVKFGNDPDFIAMMAEINKKYVSEDRIQNTGVSKPLTEDYREQARKLMTDPNYKFDLAKQERVRQLYLKSTGEA